MAKSKSNLDAMSVIVNGRIDTLLAFARHEVRAHPELAKRYVRLANAIATRHRVPMGGARKHLFCKECGLPWIVGENVKVRLDAATKRSIYTCACGAKKGFAYSKKRTKNARA